MIVFMWFIRRSRVTKSVYTLPGCPVRQDIKDRERRGKEMGGGEEGNEKNHTRTAGLVNRRRGRSRETDKRTGTQT